MELGIKLTRVADEFNSDFQITKDEADPVFLSQETDAMFILTAHLKGYRRGNIKIDINEDGTLIAIRGEKQVTETVMVGRKLYKKDVEVKGFKKVFKIPDGVILDKIMAKFKKESNLTITMPKKVKGIRGTAIEEIKEKQELVKEGSGNLQIVDEKEQIDEMPSGPGKEKQVEKPVSYEKDDVQNGHELKQGEQGQGPDLESFPGREVAPVATTMVPEEEKQAQKSETEIQEIPEAQQDKEHDEQPTTNEDVNETNNIQDGTRQEQEDKPREERCKMCIPIIAGSTILLSFVVLIFQMIRSKNQSARKRD